MTNRLNIRPLIQVSMFLLIACSTLSFTANAETTFHVRNGSAGFTAIGKPGFLRINGEGGKPTGKIILDGNKQLTVAEFEVVLSEFKTGLDLRDTHMKEKYLQVDKFPKATFKSEKVVFKGNTIPSELEVPGTLTLHGVSKPIVAVVEAHEKGDLVQGEAHFEIKLTDFNIEIPSFSGVTVAESVKIQVSFEAVTR